MYTAILYSWLFFYCYKNLFNGRLRFSVRFVFPALREMTRKTEKSWITKLIRRFWCEVLQLVSILLVVCILTHLTGSSKYGTT